MTRRLNVQVFCLLMFSLPPFVGWAQTDKKVSDAKTIENQYQALLSTKNTLDHKEFEFSYCGRYIDAKGDTIIEGECELRTVRVYFKNKDVKLIVDRKEGGEGCSYYTEWEYYFDKDQLIFLLMRSDCIPYGYPGERGRKHSLRESRYYYTSNVLFKNTEREFSGYTLELDAFLKNNSNFKDKEVNAGDDYFLNEGLKLKDNFLSKNMKSYEEKIEKLGN